MESNSLQKGIIYMLTASFFFALTGALARILRDDISNVEMVLFRNLIGVVFIGFSLLRRPPIEKGGKIGLLIFRGVIGTMALYAFFYGITKIGLAVAITYQQSYPVFLSVIAALFLREKLLAKEWIAVIIGFTGVALIFFPQIKIADFTIKYHVIGVSNALMTGMAYLSIRGLSAWYDERKIVLSFMLSGIVLPLVSLGAGEFVEPGAYDYLIAKFEWPETRSWVYIISLGIAALIGQIFLTRAFSFQKTGVIGAIGYSNIVFSIIFGVMLGDAFPGTEGLLGIFLVMLSGIMISWKKTKKL